MPPWLKDYWQLYAALVLVAGAFFRVEGIADSNRDKLEDIERSNTAQWKVISKNANDIARIQGKLD